MAAPLEPERLAELVDLAERPRVDGWSFRAALCRYAQPQPERSSAVLSVLRRVEAAFGQNMAELRSDGRDILARAEAADTFSPAGEAGIVDDSTSGKVGSADDSALVGLLGVASVLDRLGDAISGWAAHTSSERRLDRPDAEVDQVVEDVVPRLTVLGVAEEPPPRGARSRG